jgi:hypothetical protein
MRVPRHPVREWTPLRDFGQALWGDVALIRDQVPYFLFSWAFGRMDSQMQQEIRAFWSKSGGANVRLLR